MSEFKHQAVRDLAWAVSSPPIIAKLSDPCVWPESQWYRQVYEETLPWLRAVDADPSELEELVARQKDRRLGKYFETLWLYWFKHHQRYQILENNLQIIIDGETLGEIDFIVLDKATKQTTHWEVAVKFYLGVGDTREMRNWHGPNLRDRLDIKVQHLIHRQSVITKDRRVAQWLKQQGLVIDQCAVILKGRLYYPWPGAGSVKQSELPMNAISPPQCAPDHPFSWWLKQSQFDEKYDDRQGFVPLINRGWLERMSTLVSGEIYSKNSLFETLSKNKMRLPLHLQLCNTRSDGNRVFLVGENWPDKKS